MFNFSFQVILKTFWRFRYEKKKRIKNMYYSLVKNIKILIKYPNCKPHCVIVHS